MCDQHLLDRSAELLRPAADRGDLVVCDRRIDDERLTLAEDEQRRGPPEKPFESFPARDYGVSAAGRSARRYSTS